MPVPQETLKALSRTALLVQRDIYPDMDATTIATGLATTPIRLTASKEALATNNGQTAIVTAAIITAQLGVQLVLDFPEVGLLSAQPPLSGEGLRESLLDLSADLITPAITGSDGEFAIAIGREVNGQGVSLGADDWAFKLAPLGSAGRVEGKLPFGAGLGGAAVGAEVFRHIMVRMGGEFGVEPLAEHPMHDALPSSYELPPFDYLPVDAGWVDSISAGALATSALYLLLRMPGLAMRLRLIDGDIGAISNLNRYLLFRRSLLNVAKAKALETYATATLQIEGVPRRFDDESEVALMPLAPRVLVGVDHIPSRWHTQRVATGWIGVAATSHFEVVVSEHTPESPCTACLHAHDDEDDQEIPTISFVSAFSGFLLAYRLMREAHNLPSPSQTLAYPFNLAGERAIWDMPLLAREDCVVGCSASGALRVVREPGS
jgi:hypothetical protein